MNTTKTHEPDLKVRDRGRRAGGKKPSRQIQLRLDQAELESLGFYREITGGMSFARILKTCAVLGSLSFPFAYMLAKMDKVPENEFTSHLTTVAQKAAREFGEIMREKYDAIQAEEGGGP